VIHNTIIWTERYSWRRNLANGRQKDIIAQTRLW